MSDQGCNRTRDEKLVAQAGGVSAVFCSVAPTTRTPATGLASNRADSLSPDTDDRSRDGATQRAPHLLRGEQRRSAQWPRGVEDVPVRIEQLREALATLDEAPATVACEGRTRRCDEHCRSLCHSGPQIRRW